MVPNSTYDIIIKKRKGKSLSQSEIEHFAENVIKGSTPNYQVSALLMAIFLNGMTAKETYFLTKSMLESGKQLTFSDDEIIDKHSTGGVGDKTSFIVGPIAAALGIKVPMIAGRGLGHTGGTIDKLESIPGFKTSMTLKKFQHQVESHQFALIGQTKEIAPLDKQLYALRDVTGTVDSIPLITSSIMSKKLAEGISGLVLDLKIGNGAFMTTMKEGLHLSQAMLDVAKIFKKNMSIILSDMSTPLGHSLGHSLEIIESIEVLKGRGPQDTKDLSLELAGSMIHLAGLVKNHKQGVLLAKETISNGSALNKFSEMIQLQNGDSNIIHNYKLLPLSSKKIVIKSPYTGHIKTMNTKNIGLFLRDIGGGRKTLTDKIDHSVGIKLHKKTSNYIKKDEVLATLYVSKKANAKILKEEFISFYSFSKTSVPRPKLIKKKLIQWR
tara:strand:- start:3856 stop:5172 length:1317 start_codon:yes stop_codon:yes gene_type:complete